MKLYHKSNVGDTSCGTSHPDGQMEYDDTLDRAEFGARYGSRPETWGKPIPLDCAHVRGSCSTRCGEHDGALHVCYISNDRDEIEVWTGTAIQDIDGYRWETEGATA